jgi:hypothetical protein
MDENYTFEIENKLSPVIYFFLHLFTTFKSGYAFDYLLFKWVWRCYHLKYKQWKFKMASEQDSNSKITKICTNEVDPWRTSNRNAEIYFVFIHGMCRFWFVQKKVP